MRLRFLPSRLGRDVAIAAGLAAWLLTPAVAHANSIFGPDVQSVVNLGGNLFNGGGCGTGGTGGSVTTFGNGLNPGISVGGTICTTVASVAGVGSFSQRYSITAAPGFMFTDVSAFVTCGVTGTATATFSTSTPGGSISGPCPTFLIPGQTGTVGGTTTFAPVSSFITTIGFSGSGNPGDTFSLLGASFQLSLVQVTPPVPEPATLWLLGAGLAALLAVGGKRWLAHPPAQS